MRKYLLMMAVVALAAGATGAPGTTVRVGNLVVTGNGSFSPKALSRIKPTPASLNISGKVRTVDGTHPPAARKVVIETDKNIAFTTKGYPVCTSDGRDVRDPKAVEKTCGEAILGEGSMSISVKFPGPEPILAKSRLLLFNGGAKGGVTTLYVYAYLTQPITTAVVITVKVQRVKNRRYGIKMTASIPVIAGGAGSVTDFGLLVNKKYTYEGRKVSVVTAKCTDGKLRSTAEAVFDDGTKAKTEVSNTCTPKK